MKSKRAMIDRRNAAGRMRREQKKNPPGPYFKLFDGYWKLLFVLLILSVSVAVSYDWFIETNPGPEETALIPFIAERVATLMLFMIIATSCVVGIRLMIKPSANSSSRVRQRPDGRRIRIMKFVLLLFFILIIAVSVMICWAQLKLLVVAWKFML
ncbi:hypothetical protein [Paenibacillus crassostreae]|uniref:Uncharacterized protein n=1 Tax=Paenibacillus crassostreae TaxID=1763538 RepID=A0A162KPT2_9BACL|nr:hypothetical protein [Paenibacillus crassostreae]AOZ92988.1 hypothetical protein LPB68_12700 [Paenibacillus crassostreae]OAB71923.1 hypothetical protein PNBC_18190 [Paenibacillus crassostreae]